MMKCLLTLVKKGRTCCGRPRDHGPSNSDEKFTPFFSSSFSISCRKRGVRLTLLFELTVSRKTRNHSRRFVEDVWRSRFVRVVPVVKSVNRIESPQSDGIPGRPARFTNHDLSSTPSVRSSSHTTAKQHLTFFTSLLRQLSATCLPVYLPWFNYIQKSFSKLLPLTKRTTPHPRLSQ